MTLDDVTDEVYYASMKEMFNSDGWKILLAELDSQVDLIEDIQQIKTFEELRFKQGQLATIGYLMNFQETLKTAEESKAEDEADVGS